MRRFATIWRMPSTASGLLAAPANRPKRTAAAAFADCTRAAEGDSRCKMPTRRKPGAAVGLLLESRAIRQAGGGACSAPAPPTGCEAAARARAAQSARGLLAGAGRDLDSARSPARRRTIRRIPAAAAGRLSCSSRSSATGDEVPGWGHADAYLEFGRQLQARGDPLGARNWIERP